MSYSFHKSGCTHWDATNVLGMGKKCRLWAGSSSELSDHCGQWELIISAVGYTKFLDPPFTVNEQARALLPEKLFKWATPACIGIDWPDRGVPNLSPQWWKEIALALKRIDGDVGVCCMGGHGRTGTMLAILASLGGKVKKNKCPVVWVRKRYCKEAVESDAQIEYIERVTGREVTSSASDQYHYSARPAAGGAEAKAPPTEEGKTYSLGDLAAAQAKKVVPLLAISTGSATGETSTSASVLDGGQGTLLLPADGAVKTHEPTDLELLQALDRGDDGEITALIEGAGGRRWTPVYGDDSEIVGWCEEDLS